MLATSSITYKFDYTPDPAFSPQDRLIAFQTHFRAHPAPADFSDPAFIAVLRTYARLLREARTRTLHEYAITIPSEKRRACAKHWADRFDTYAVREHARQQREQKDRDQEDLRINRHRRIAANAEARHRISLISLATLQARLARLEQQIQDIHSAPLPPKRKRPPSTPSLSPHETGERKSTETHSIPAQATVLDAPSIAAPGDSHAPVSTSASTPTTPTPSPTLAPSTPPRQKSPDASAPSAPNGSREIASDQRADIDSHAPRPDPTRLLNPDP